MIRVAGAVVSVFILLFIVGCSQYDQDYQYTPRPATSEIPATQPQDPPPIATMATVIGVRYDDDQDKIPPSVEIHLRIDNNGPWPALFDPMSMELSNMELARMGAPVIRPPAPISLSPGQSAYLTAYFPFPPGQSQDTMDLNSLQLRWSVQLGNRPIGQQVYFTRVWPSYYGPGPYWYPPPPPPFGFYGGVVVVHRRW